MKKLLTFGLLLCLLAGNVALAGETEVLFESALGYTMTYDPGWVIPVDADADAAKNTDVFLPPSEDMDYPDTVSLTITLMLEPEYTLDMAATDAEAVLQSVCDTTERLETSLMFDGAPAFGYIGIEDESHVITELFVVAGERGVYQITITYHVAYENGIGSALHDIAATIVPAP